MLTLHLLAGAFASQTCTLAPSTTPLSIDIDGSVVEYLDLAVPDGTVDAISVTASNVVLRNLRIAHPATGTGIRFVNSNNITIENVEVFAVGNDASGPSKCASYDC